ncbi:MAG: O-antigen ligase family protein [Elusimicrobia bacterium]|nr:O-antigen ligase family protein [Elusimicrobiota bacterium]
MALLPLLLWSTALEIRGSRVVIGGMSFFWTTARVALAFFCCISGVWFLRRGFKIIWTFHRSLFLLSLAFAGAAVISVLFGRFPAPGLEQLIFYGLFFYLFWIFLAWPQTQAWKSIPEQVFLLGVFLAAIGILEHFFPPAWQFCAQMFRPMTNGGFADRSLASLQNPTTYGAVMVICYAAGLLCQARFSWPVFVAAEALLFAATAFSQSRLSVVLLVSLCVMRIYWLHVKEASRPLVARQALALFIFLIAVPSIPRIRSWVNDRPDSLTVFHRMDQLLSYRLTQWQTAWGVWQKNKIIGSGIGSYPYVTDTSWKSAGLSQPMFSHPHNLWLRILCETGLVGFSLFSVFCLMICWKIWKKGVWVSAIPLAVFLFVEFFEELSRDSLPSLIAVLLAVYALRQAGETKLKILSRGEPVLAKALTAAGLPPDQTFIRWKEINHLRTSLPAEKSTR